MQPLCWGHLRAGWADRMLQADFLRPDAMPIRLKQTLFLLMHIPLLAKSLSEQNRQLPLNVLYRPAQGKDDLMHSIQFDEDYRMEDTPEKRRLNYLIKEYPRSEETRKRRAGFDAESTEDPKSKRVHTGAGQENLTGELMDSMARRLSAMST